MYTRSSCFTHSRNVQVLSHEWKGGDVLIESEWNSEIFNTQVTTILAHGREMELYTFWFVKNIWM